MSGDEAKPGTNPDLLDEWVEEARVEYEHRRQIREIYRSKGREADFRPSESTEKEDIKAKDILDEVLRAGETYEEQQLFDILLSHGWTARYIERAFQRVLTTNKNAGRIVMLEPGQFRRGTEQERVMANKNQPKRNKRADAPKKVE